MAGAGISDPDRVESLETTLRPRPPRKNLFLAASINSGALSTAVRIRNLSETGVLIEAPALPDVGEHLRLKRLEVEIGGTVVWRFGNRCGVHFDGHISIEDWIAGKRRHADAKYGQARVDEIQRMVRAGETLAEDAVFSPATVVSDVNLDIRIADELGYVGRLLDTVGDTLSDDPVLLQRHAAALQNLDAAGQVLAHLREILAADDRPAAIDRVAMTDLKLRLKRKALY